MPIRAVVWGENVHEQHNKIVAESIRTACTSALPIR